MTGAFRKDVEADLNDPEYRRASVLARHRIATIDGIVNELDARRDECGLSKADLGRMAGMNAAAVRRLFTNAAANPTLGTLADLATALGLRVTLQPLPPDDAREAADVLASEQSAARETGTPCRSAGRARTPRQAGAFPPA